MHAQRTRSPSPITDVIGDPCGQQAVELIVMQVPQEFEVFDGALGLQAEEHGFDVLLPVVRHFAEVGRHFAPPAGEGAALGNAYLPRHCYEERHLV